jgi:hypothetical protein
VLLLSQQLKSCIFISCFFTGYKRSRSTFGSPPDLGFCLSIASASTTPASSQQQLMQLLCQVKVPSQLMQQLEVVLVLVV